MKTADKTIKPDSKWDQNKFSSLPKPKLDKASIPIILWNLFPVMGVVFLGWEPESVFICYALETIIVGLFNVFRMLVIHCYGTRDIKLHDPAGLWLIPFFLVHFYGFVLIQLGIFFDNDLFQTVSGIINQRSYLIALAAFLLKNTLDFTMGFIYNGIYSKRTMRHQMFEPYPRVILQQIVVMFGGFIFDITGNGYPVLIVFVGIKMYVDLMYPQIIALFLAKLKPGKMGLH
ncbi:DUF6498-containing protein [Flavobacterium psychrotolerans]|uniref:Uncharacterized protein n=1 Tax=Flavobacterium psychrotolerans TaxID=2169410 RepID=A0A2U1JL50_9FLAO|nr:DUF6498-containing protein [Flavobacterium psychrotolerans]PWA05901.1 hypothetical protein DB895_05625 [Flavobacterium psychrotolerans]